MLENTGDTRENISESDIFLACWFSYPVSRTSGHT